MSCNLLRLGLFELVTNGVIVDTANAVYGINPRIWRSMPNQGVALLKIRQAVPTAGASLPVAIAVPNVSTVTSVGDNNGCCGNTVTNVEILDPINESFLGSQIVNNTEHLIYFNKVKGIIRMLDCCKATAPTPSA